MDTDAGRVVAPRIFLDDNVGLLEVQMGGAQFLIRGIGTFALDYSLVEGIYVGEDALWKNRDYPDHSPLEPKFGTIQIATSDRFACVLNERGNPVFRYADTGLPIYRNDAKSKQVSFAIKPQYMEAIYAKEGALFWNRLDGLVMQQEGMR